MLFNTLRLILLVMFLSSCASSSKQETQYYLLNQQSEQKTKSLPSEKNNLKKINIAKIKLPEYLTQPYLVMQLNQHQLHYAQFHLWAESLELGIAKALISDLNSSESSFRYNLSSLNSTVENSLVLEINHFYPTNLSEVILDGKFWLLSTNGKILLEPTHFQFSAELQQNGYQHSVAEMRKLISQLSDFLSNALTLKINKVKD